MSNTAASSSPDLRDAASLPDKWCHHLVPIGGVGVSDTVGGGSCGGRFPNCSGHLGVVTKRVARDMFPVSNCKGYMSTPQA